MSFRLIRRIDEAINREQQTVADNYFRIGLLPKGLNVRNAMLTPDEYARLMPVPLAGKTE